MSEPSKAVEAAVITGLGMMTAVGHQAAQAVTSILAGVMRLVEFPDYEPIVRDPGVMFPEPLIAVPVEGVTDGMKGMERLFALGVPALKERWRMPAWEKTTCPRPPCWWPAASPPGAVRTSRLARVFAPRLGQRVAKTRLRHVQYFPSGTAGFLHALRLGIDLLKQGQCGYCVVGGVDSWLDLETLKWLDEARRLKSKGTVDAFVPGEAAAFVVLELRSTAEKRKKEPYAECGAVGLAEEKNTIWADTPCTAEGLSQCVRAVLAALDKAGKTPDIALCDLNGESYRSTEWAYATTKAFRDGKKAPSLVHPADCMGDVGAAIGGVLVGLAAFAMKKQLAPWTTALVWASSDDGARAAGSVIKT